MPGLGRLGARALGGVVLVVALAGCADQGDLSITNDGPNDVVVRIGDEDIDVHAWGGVVIMDSGCTPGDVTIEFRSGRSIALPGPVCPEQEIVISDDSAALRPVSGS